MPRRLQLSCGALLIIVLANPNLSWSPGLHQLNPILLSSFNYRTLRKVDLICTVKRVLCVFTIFGLNRACKTKNASWLEICSDHVNRYGHKSRKKELLHFSDKGITYNQKT